MNEDMWLSPGTELEREVTAHSLVYSGLDWQIIELQDSSRALLVRPELTKKWDELELLPRSLFSPVPVCEETVLFAMGRASTELRPVGQPFPMMNAVEAKAFASALRETRKVNSEVPIHDGIYFEMYSRLLPTWTDSELIGDDILLGMWLTGGVGVSVKLFSRVCELAVWLPRNQLANIVETAGFPRPDEETSVENSQLELQDSGLSQDADFTEGRFEMPGRSDLEAFFRDHVIDIIEHPKRYEKMGIDFPAPFILHGPPGCGKTFAVQQLIAYLGLPDFAINSGSIGSVYHHGTSLLISEVFEQAIEAAPSVIVIDEMDAFLAGRELAGGSGLHHVEEVAEFLTRIPIAAGKKVLLIGMTNMLHLIDPAVMRRGRFDHVIKVEMPSQIEVSALLDSLLSKIPREDNLNVEPVISALIGKPLSDAAFVIREASRIAAKAAKTELDQESLMAALSVL